jgi:hypothetical protein
MTYMKVRYENKALFGMCKTLCMDTKSSCFRSWEEPEEVSNAYS